MNLLIHGLKPNVMASKVSKTLQILKLKHLYYVIFIEIIKIMQKKKLESNCQNSYNWSSRNSTVPACNHLCSSPPDGTCTKVKILSLKLVLYKGSLIASLGL